MKAWRLRWCVNELIWNTIINAISTISSYWLWNYLKQYIVKIVPKCLSLTLVKFIFIYSYTNFFIVMHDREIIYRCFKGQFIEGQWKQNEILTKCSRNVKIITKLKVMLVCPPWNWRIFSLLIRNIEKKDAQTWPDRMKQTLFPIPLP